MILESKWGFLRPRNRLVIVSRALHVPYTCPTRVLHVPDTCHVFLMYCCISGVSCSILMILESKWGFLRPWNLLYQPTCSKFEKKIQWSTNFTFQYFCQIKFALSDISYLGISKNIKFTEVYTRVHAALPKIKSTTYKLFSAIFLTPLLL